jgi:Phosphate-selective porin O and P
MRSDQHTKPPGIRYGGWSPTAALALAGLLVGAPAAAQPFPTPPAPTAAAPVAQDPGRAATGDRSALAVDGFPMAGWHNGLFFLRDRNDSFRLYVQARLNVDAYTYFGPGVSPSSLEPTLILRRIRPELGGEIGKRWNWMLAGDFGTTALDNPKGASELAASSAGAAPTATSGKFAPVEAPAIKAAPTDVWVNLHAGGFFNVMAGQYNGPFTMENRTSEKYGNFMERSIVSRDLGIPANKEIGIMAWGEVESRHFAYQVGAFLGDGQNRPNVDGGLDGIGRVFFHPFASLPGPLKELQVGGSFRGGKRSQGSVAYDYPGMTTQGNFQFWGPTYAGSKGLVHIIPAGNQLGAGAELRIPLDRFDLQSEFVYVSNGTREAIDGFQATKSERYGDLGGYSYYVQLAIWAMGKRNINGQPGYEVPPTLDFSRTDPEDPPHALQILLKWEQLATKYTSASRLGVVDPKNADGDIKVNVLSAGANYWFTKHLRLSVNYVVNMFPGARAVKPSIKGDAPQDSGQRAISPGQTLSPGQDDSARDTGNVLHELLFRVGVGF